jgi:hypothetical protein
VWCDRRDLRSFNSTLGTIKGLLASSSGLSLTVEEKAVETSTSTGSSSSSASASASAWRDEPWWHGLLPARSPSPAAAAAATGAPPSAGRCAVAGSSSPCLPPLLAPALLASPTLRPHVTCTSGVT